MNTVAQRCAALLSLTLAACGGGSGGGGGSSAPPPAIPTLAVQLATSDAAPQFVEGSAGADLSITASYTGGTAAAVVPVFQFDQTVFAQQGAIDTSTPGKYVLHLHSVPGLAVGSYAGQINVRLCQESACAVVYPGSSQSASYALKVALDDWHTFQRNTSHNAYLHVTLDPAKFSKLWTWSLPPSDLAYGDRINTVATGNGMVFVTKDVYYTPGEVFALKESDGSQAWHYALGTMASEGPPAFSNGSVYFAAADDQENASIRSLDASTGSLKFATVPYAATWIEYFAPTVVGDAVLHTATGVSNYSTVDGTRRWGVQANAYDRTTAAVDDKYIYQNGTATGGTLSVFNRITGDTVATIKDTFAPGFLGYSEFAAPMLGSSHNVIAFSGGSIGASVSTNSEQYKLRVLINYDIDKKAIAWHTAGTYLTHPALANGLVYAANVRQLDAISEADGHIVWSWLLPVIDESFHRNVLVTDNLVFVSSEKSVYAIDLKTHQAVWQYPKGGSLAISAGGILYITVGASESTGELVAIKVL